MGSECSSEPEIGRALKWSEKCTAIVLAAGQGKRMHSKIQKQFLEIQGYPVLYYSLHCFQESQYDSGYYSGNGSEDVISYCKEQIVDKYAFSKVTQGYCLVGKNGMILYMQGYWLVIIRDYVFIHDGARPFINEEILRRGLSAVQQTGACVIGMPSKDTVKIADTQGNVLETPDRNCVWTIQTPQIFSYALICRGT